VRDGVSFGLILGVGGGLGSGTGGISSGGIDIDIGDVLKGVDIANRHAVIVKDIFGIHIRISWKRVHGCILGGETFLGRVTKISLFPRKV